MIPSYESRARALELFVRPRRGIAPGIPLEGTQKLVGTYGQSPSCGSVGAGFAPTGTRFAPPAVLEWANLGIPYDAIEKATLCDDGIPLWFRSGQFACRRSGLSQKNQLFLKKPSRPRRRLYITTHGANKLHIIIA
uniref:Uncharacterized protein n=1 Tax=Tetranychus urticae TaxID=32264 RepID=T1K4W5_TETUR